MVESTRTPKNVSSISLQVPRRPKSFLCFFMLKQTQQFGIQNKVINLRSISESFKLQ